MTMRLINLVDFLRLGDLKEMAMIMQVTKLRSLMDEVERGVKKLFAEQKYLDEKEKQ